MGIAEELGLGNRTNMIMQSAFFKLAKVIPAADAVTYLKESIEHAYGKKGRKVVEMNNAAVDKGMTHMVAVAVPAAWGGRRGRNPGGKRSARFCPGCDDPDEPGQRRPAAPERLQEIWLRGRHLPHGHRPL